MSVYKGACHCGKVQFEVDFELAIVVECNCSICTRKGAIYASAREEQFRITQGEDELTLYQFGTETAKHYFCQHCGIHPFLRSRLKPDGWTINVNCLEGIERQGLEPKLFNGQNWEEAARAWTRRR